MDKENEDSAFGETQHQRNNLVSLDSQDFDHVHVPDMDT